MVEPKAKRPVPTRYSAIQIEEERVEMLSYWHGLSAIRPETHTDQPRPDC